MVQGTQLSLEREIVRASKRLDSEALKFEEERKKHKEETALRQMLEDRMAVHEVQLSNEIALRHRFI